MLLSKEALETACQRFVESITSVDDEESRGLTEQDLATALADTLGGALRIMPQLLQERTAAARQDQNRLCSTLSRLPGEVVVIIFRESLPSYSERHYWEGLFILISVCRSFRQLIHSTPSFWTLINQEQTEDFVTLALQRSKSASLSVTGSDRFLDRVMELSKPIRELKLRLRRRSTGEALSKPFPHLEALEINGNYANISFGPAGQLFSGDAPRLVRVTFSDVWIPWNSKVLSGLTYIHLSYIGKPGPTIPDLLKILAVSPALETLWLSEVEFISEGYSPPESLNERIQLPQLKELRLEVLEPQPAAALLHAIRPSSAYKRFVVQCLSDNRHWDDSTPQYHNTGEDAVHLQDLEHHGPHLRGLFKRAHAVVLTLLPRSWRLGSRIPGGTDLELYIPGITVIKWIPWVLETVARNMGSEEASCSSVPVSVRLELDTQSTMLEMLEKTKVDELYITPNRDADPVLEYLTHPTTSNWTLPHLTGLRIFGRFTTEKLLRMMRQRYTLEGVRDVASGIQVEGPPLDLSDHARPANLQKLVIHGNDDSMGSAIDELRSIVAKWDGSLTWTPRGQSLERDIFGTSESDLSDFSGHPAPVHAQIGDGFIESDPDNET